MTMNTSTVKLAASRYNPTGDRTTSGDNREMIHDRMDKGVEEVELGRYVG